VNRIAGLGRTLAFVAFLTLPAALIPVQEPSPESSDTDVKLPSGKSQRDEILRAEHEKSLEDVSRIRKLAEELEADLQKKDFRVLSLPTLKKTEEIEKLAHRIRGRMKR
jgi:hypothetical protein